MHNPLTLEPAKYYLLRRPLQSVNTFYAMNELADADDELFEDTLLKKYKDDPMLMEAIYTASPELHKEFCKVIHEGAKASPKLILTLYKYLSRMSTRCTPYGLFAGCSTGVLADETRISYDDVVYRKESRLDMNYVNELVNHLQMIPEVKRNLSYNINSSLYSTGNFYRYIEYKIENKKRQYTLASVRKSEILDLLIHAAGKGIDYLKLLELLQSFDADITTAEGEAFIAELIDGQLLISELEPTITGEIYMDKLVEKLNAKVPAGIIDLLQQINMLLKKGGIDAFEHIHQIINEHFVKCQSKDLIQTDLFYDHSQNQVKAGITEEITAQISALYKLASKGTSKDMETFKSSFLERYEEKEIPLLQALDAESGVSYGSTGKSDHLPLLDGLTTKLKKMARSTTWSPLNVLVNKLFRRTVDQNGLVAELTDEDLMGLEDQPDLAEQTPSSLYAFGSIIASSPARLDAGEYLFSLATCSGPSGANIMGRFCHGDQGLYKNVVETLETDEPDDEQTVYAEIVHLPESRVGNILVRPHLRKYEIPFLGKSSMDAENQIRVQDLMVSVKNGKVVLRSRKLNKIVIPRLSTAHNYMSGLSVYRFLCDLQKEGLYHSIYWDWANLSDASFLPRVVYKNIILSKASWKISKLAFNKLTGNFDDDILYLSSYIEQLKIPRFVCIAEHDNELLIDTTNQLGKKLLHHELNKKGAVKLTEFLFDPENCFINDGGQNHFANEILLPLSNKQGIITHRKPEVPVASNTQRVFIPGSEWIYMKIYGGTKTSEKILVETISPYLQSLIDHKIITAWFFIRYTDPHHHIRLRMKVPAKQTNEIQQVISGIYNLLSDNIEQHGLYKIQLDTYVRELERYGHNNIDNSEEWFYHDSVCTTTILNMIEGDVGETFRWLLAARGLDMLLNDFGIGLDQKIMVFERLSDAFFNEYNGDKALNLTLNDKFRKHSRSVRSFLNPAEDLKNEIEEATAVFQERSGQSQAVISSILALFDGDILKNDQGFSLLTSYIHMYMNRFFLSKQRQHELVLYNVIRKHYLSEKAINRKKEMSLT